MDIIHCNITVFGRVQGVGFRYHTVSEAQSYKINGYVKNLYNGNVYIEAEGLKDNIETFIAWCKAGPPRAIINNIFVSYSTVLGFNSFEVKY
jgi:acylphosphatase